MEPGTAAPKDERWTGATSLNSALGLAASAVKLGLPLLPNYSPHQHTSSKHGNSISIFTSKLQSLAMADQGLFSTELLSPEVQAVLPEGYQLRALRRTDFDAGFLDCLRVLTTVGDIPKEKWEERYDWIARQDGTYFVLVIEDTNASPPRIVGTGALLAERKL